MMRRRRWLAIGLGLALGVARAARRAHANGAPVKIELRYIEGFSNFGPTTATGTLEVVAIEGDVTLRVQGLPRLRGDLYQAWLTNSRTGDLISIGKFNTEADGTAFLQTVLDIADREFNLAVISVEPEPDSSPNPDARLSLAGFFPGAEPMLPTPTPTPATAATLTPTPAATPTSTPEPTTPAATPSPTAEPLPPIPRALPRTGHHDASAASWWARLWQAIAGRFGRRG